MKSLSLNRPHAIVMVGIPGSGKSFFAEKFAETFGAPYVSHYTLAAALGDNNPTTLTALTATQLQELFKTRHSIVLDVAADTKASRTALVKIINAANYETLFVWVQTDPQTAKMRALRQQKNQTNRQLSDEEHTRLVRRFTMPQIDKENTVVISGKHTYATQARVVLKRLSGPRADASSQSAPPTRSLSDIKRHHA